MRLHALACAINVADVLIIEDRCRFDRSHLLEFVVELRRFIDGVGHGIDDWHRGGALPSRGSPGSVRLAANRFGAVVRCRCRHRAKRTKLAAIAAAGPDDETGNRPDKLSATNPDAIAYEPRGSVDA